ncbi:homocysteine S-methyltransferase family protein [Nitrospirillum iridis]|uniref:S-methylmethionine-dependent homocysteine/selenocysteine methylase n=1 Tax=Nitrospirillum iridis TaxID=765888 RepID=A0A7X0EFW3_9PROT|nr:homocysteine S-methyltransferase family protein [Nitrospirillum iridis]MBB6252914.1 S-methylmethionine-dependent homocysteine/selenocysteine methylase [Nitrospirillum iridis]
MADRIILLDGGMGRELQRMGAPFRQPEWSALALIEAPDYVGRAHAAFLEAGADIVTTNSYALVPFHIGEARFAREARDLASLAGRLARQAADAKAGARVAGSLPPLFGSYQARLFDAARAQDLLAPLVQGLGPHVDLWLAETQSAVAEVRAVRAALGADARPLWLSFTLEDEAADATTAPRLRGGEAVAAATTAALELGAAGLLFNCSQPEVMGPALAAAQGAAGVAPLPLGVYANAFPPQPKNAAANDGLDELRADLTPATYLDWARRWVDAGATIVGGCCGIGPDHIRALAGALR